MKKTVTVSDPNSISVSNINSTTDFSGSISVNKLASTATMYSNGTTAITDSTKPLSTFNITGSQTITIKAIDKTGALETSGFSLTFDPTVETLDSVISKINASSGVSAFFDPTTKKVALSAKNTGTTGAADIVLSGSFLTSNLNLDPDNKTAAAKTVPVGTLGTNASFVYNGLTTSRSTNTFNINGAQITLKQVTSNPVTFSSAPDVDAIMDTVSKFVDKYNTTIDKINQKINEAKNRDFPPLTDDQKTNMKDTDIQNWTAKAKSGTLKNDSTLANALVKMRIDLSTPVTVATGVKQLSDIGIQTSSNYLDRGKLVIDTDKLRAAIQSDPNAVYQLFQTDGATTDQKGLANRLRDTIKSTMSDIQTKAGSSYSVNSTFLIGKNIDDIGKSITSFQDLLTKKENRYYSQFSAMEQAMQKATSQSAYIMKSFGG